jgi:hypothetical protein
MELPTTDGSGEGGLDMSEEGGEDGWEVAKSASSLELRRAGVLTSSSSSEEDCGSPSDTYLLMAMSL